MPSERSVLERVTKIAVLASTLAAFLFTTFHAGRDYVLLPWCAGALFAGGYAAGKARPATAAGAVLAAGYLTPAFLLLTIGYRYYYLTVWIAAFAGVTSATGTITWNYPRRFLFPLVVWALVVAVGWPVVAIRLMDWTPSILWHVPPAAGDIIHAIPAAVWISHVALVHLLGLLWIDWLFGRFNAAALARFRTTIVRPMLVAGVVASAIGVYQALVDPAFVSIGSWAAIGRTSGALADGNASGALAALWVPIVIGVAAGTGSWRSIALGASALLLVASVWVSGSRTAFLCALMALPLIAHLVLSERRQRWKLALAAGAMAAVLAAALMAVGPSIRNPVARVDEILPELSSTAVRGAVRQLWERGGYGTAADAMIRENPIQGVGVGAYHFLASDYLYLATRNRLEGDNAQNWFRHQLAELGVLGAAGALWWSLLLLGAIAAAAAGRSPGDLGVRYGLVGIGLASLLGMPSQNLFVALTIWTFGFWAVLSSSAASAAPSPGSPSRGWRPFAAAIAIALTFAGATLYAGKRHLRPPFVAKKINYLYEYGVHESMDTPEGRTQTTRHAVSVMAAPSSTLKLTVWVEHPDADQRPVEVAVWIDHVQVVRGHFPRNVPLTRTIPVAGGNQRFVLETLVDRTFVPAGGGQEVGLNVAWTFE